MKKILLIVMMLISWQAVAQTVKPIDIKTEAAEVTVFIEGAQVLRKKTINIPAGKSTLRFTDLSPFVDAKSVQVKLTGQAMVLGVNYQVNTEVAVKKISEDKKEELEKKYDVATEQLTIAKINLGLVNEDVQFLNENKKIGGANTGLSLVALRETATYFRDRMKALKMQEAELTKKILELEYDKRLLHQQMSQQPDTKPSPKGEVLVEVETKQGVQANVEISYYVKNASWYPSYDIRATSISEPITLLYKANVQQNTKEDWQNVKLKISSSNPKLGNIAPRLQTYRLDYYVAAPRYNVELGDNEIKGVVVDEHGEPVIAANITFQGTTVGTLTDVNGQFALSIPRNAKQVNISYLGYKTQNRAVSNQYMKIVMQEDNTMLDEVVVIGYGSSSEKRLTGSISKAAKSAPRTDLAMPTEVIENQMSVDFDIKIPYSISSGTKATVIEVDRHSLSAEYEYYAIPKVNKEAFLLANISDWEKYNLLEGEANIFFENTYIGKTILDTRSVSDTLNISLGRDKSIVVNREKEKDTSSKKLFGSKQEVSREWKISVRNTKKQEINFTLLDQVPVSLRDEIEVEIQNTSDGSVNETTGEVKWSLKIKPATKKELTLKYKVKYPKDKTLNVE